METQIYLLVQIWQCSMSLHNFKFYEFLIIKHWEVWGKRQANTAPVLWLEAASARDKTLLWPPMREGSTDNVADRQADPTNRAVAALTARRLSSPSVRLKSCIMQHNAGQVLQKMTAQSHPHSWKNPSITGHYEIILRELVKSMVHETTDERHYPKAPLNSYWAWPLASSTKADLACTGWLEFHKTEPKNLQCHHQFLKNLWPQSLRSFLPAYTAPHIQMASSVAKMNA